MFIGFLIYTCNIPADLIYETQKRHGERVREMDRGKCTEKYSWSAQLKTTLQPCNLTYVMYKIILLKLLAELD